MLVIWVTAIINICYYIKLLGSKRLVTPVVDKEIILVYIHIYFQDVFARRGSWPPNTTAEQVYSLCHQIFCLGRSSKARRSPHQRAREQAAGALAEKQGSPHHHGRCPVAPSRSDAARLTEHLPGTQPVTSWTGTTITSSLTALMFNPRSFRKESRP